ncbi:winged helix-turn-helix domain-containing protein [Saccharicrinis sp. 156]|uniref:winged helix-turn-helix domain-containing protein n=1 Tax=Saccharicrinis sp. 156 TaxID=3417574 RepID=UPI003D34C6DB
MFKDLDPILHSQIRLAIMSILVGVESAEFAYLLDNINTTKGNLSFQLSKLKDAAYVDIKKSFKGNYPLTTCTITENGINAYESYISIINDYFKEYRLKKNKKK